MGFYNKSRGKGVGMRRILSLLVCILFGTTVLVYLLKTNAFTRSVIQSSEEIDEHHVLGYSDVMLEPRKKTLPELTNLSALLDRKNQLPPRNLDLFPILKDDHINIVLYVHNRPKYLKVVVESLSNVDGIAETLLIVSHDGYFEEMNEIVEGIKFCQVKQIFAPYSPHLYPNSFPGSSPNDCRDKDDSKAKNCVGNADQYGNHRSPKIVSLKHHWWWMMNTIWDGLKEMQQYSGHVVFIEEDHLIFPNAYRNIQLLTSLKHTKCPYCYAANLAPTDVNSKGEGWELLIAEKIGNVGYAFNRTVWRKIHARAREFCSFDDYNWDITMWATIYPSWGTPVYTLRGPRRSAAHFGKCGLHQGQVKDIACIDNGVVDVGMEDIDNVPNINPDWAVRVYEHQGGYQSGFKGWGGWSDKRDHQLCMDFASMYHHEV